MNARDVIQALQARHSKDVFVTEVTPGQKRYRLDAWAMRRSWSNFCTFGYEVKVSRPDFLRDQKYTEYFQYAHEFYLVCPWGLIDPREVAEGCGLIWITKNGNMARQKLRAPARKDPDLLPILLRVLMSNAKIVDGEIWDGRTPRDNRIEAFRKFLEDKASLQQLGHLVGRKIYSIVRNEKLKIANLERRENDLKFREEEFERRVMSELPSIDAEHLLRAINRHENRFDQMAGELKRSLEAMRHVVKGRNA